MIILPPSSRRRGGGTSVKVPPQKLIPAVLFALLMMVLGIYATIETQEPIWAIAMILIGDVPLLFVVLSAAREQQRAAQGRPIVEDARRGR